jgi:hypothetical protein
MAFDSKDWEIICETLQEFQKQLEAKVNADLELFDEPYPIKLQQEARWVKDTNEIAHKLLKLQKDFIDMIKKGPLTTG